MPEIKTNMRKHADWMVEVDERILEFLFEEGNRLPSVIRDQISEKGVAMDYTGNYIGDRCRLLANAGLLLNVGGGNYSITEEGEAFLDGDLDAGELPDPSEE